MRSSFFLLYIGEVKINYRFTFLLWVLTFLWLTYCTYVWYFSSTWEIHELHQLMGAVLMVTASSITHLPRTNRLRLSIPVFIFTIINLVLSVIIWLFPSFMRTIWNLTFLSFGIHFLFALDDGIMQKASKNWMRYLSFCLGLFACLPILFKSNSKIFFLLAVFAFLIYSILVLIQLFLTNKKNIN